ncbi:MAG: zf-TFIIB domain-containing protein [Ignavibacteriales bacterium]|nr:zf-TFIIB domain-containing protein [Ignavibacteriales bacterium]
MLELEQIEVDYCTSCEGVWLDAGELELLLETDEDRNRLINLFKEATDVKEKATIVQSAERE